MTMENIIKKAIKGGYELRPYYYDEGGGRGDAPYEVMLLDPLFWKALGKVKGWDEKYSEKEWLNIALHFHKLNLTEGWDSAIKYLEEVTYD